MVSPAASSTDVSMSIPLVERSWISTGVEPRAGAFPTVSRRKFLRTLPRRTCVGRGDLREASIVICLNQLVSADDYARPVNNMFARCTGNPVTCPLAIKPDQQLPFHRSGSGELGPRCQVRKNTLLPDGPIPSLAVRRPLFGPARTVQGHLSHGTGWRKTAPALLQTQPGIAKSTDAR